MNLLTYQIVFLTKGDGRRVHLRETTKQKKKRKIVWRRGLTIRIEMTPCQGDVNLVIVHKRGDMGWGG